MQTIVLYLTLSQCPLLICPFFNRILDSGNDIFFTSHFLENEFGFAVGVPVATKLQ